MNSVAWLIAASGIAVIFTVIMFSTGALYARPVVTRMQQAHDREVERMIKAHDQALARSNEDGDYYRRAAQSCALANAHLDGQLRTVKTLLEQCRRDHDG